MQVRSVCPVFSLADGANPRLWGGRPLILQGPIYQIFGSFGLAWLLVVASFPILYAVARQAAWRFPPAMMHGDPGKNAPRFFLL
jgi:hypothetical protein